MFLCCSAGGRNADKRQLRSPSAGPEKCCVSWNNWPKPLNISFRIYSNVEMQNLIEKIPDFHRGVLTIQVKFFHSFCNAVIIKCDRDEAVACCVIIYLVITTNNVQTVVNNVNTIDHSPGGGTDRGRLVSAGGPDGWLLKFWD